MKMGKHLAVAALIAGVVVMSTDMGWAQTGRGLHKKIYAVPAVGKVTIDGKLDDWDLSGQIYSYVVAETADMMSARLAVMYDAEALYISAVVRDTSPMMNRHDPKVDPEKAWDADVCQIWYSLDPDLPYPLNASQFEKSATPPPVATMFLWYFTDRKEPNLALLRSFVPGVVPVRPDLGVNGVIPNANFQGAFVKAEDGNGYTLEYRIPFATMGLKRAPKANDLLANTFAVFWGTPDGLKTAGGAAWLYDVMGRAGFPFQESGCWGKMAFSEKGNLPKALVEEGLPPEKPLPLKFAYELPRDRQVTVQLFDPSNRVVRLLVAQQDRRAGKNTELWDGLDSQGRPLPPGNYTWKGVQHDPITWKALFSVHNSGTPPWPTDDNKGGWGGDHGTPSTVCSVPGGMVLAWNGCEYGWGIIRVDPNGKKLWGTKHCAEHLATDGKRLFIAGDYGFNEEGVQVLDLTDSRPINFGNGKPSLMAPAGGNTASNRVTGLAYAAGKVYVSLGQRDLIVAYAAESGELQTTWAVPAPGRLAVQSDGSLVALSGTSLVTINLEGGNPLPPRREGIRALQAGLDAPTGLAVGTNGTIYVANGGKSQDVSVFDSAGKLLRTIGKAGGRPAKGTFDREGLYAPGGIALDAQNRLWVAETTDGPKRISVWDTSSGTNVAEYFGGSSYFGYGYIDPAQPSEILAHSVLWAIDWKNLKGTPSTTVWRKTAPDMIEAINPDGYQGLAKILTAADGRQYMWGNGQAKSILLRRDGDVFKPFVAAINIYGSPLYPGQGIPLLDDLKKYPHGQYFWQDQNNDQCVQPEEVTPMPQGFWNMGLAWVDRDLTLCLTTGHLLKPKGTTEGGWPRYDLADLVKSSLVGKVNGYVWRDPDGSTYSSAGNLIKWSPTGEALWSYSGITGWHDALNLPMVGPGRLWGMTGPMGTAGEFFGMMTYFGVNHIFTRDGIYVAAVLKDGRLGGRGSDEGQPEGQGGQFVKLRPDPNGPDRYFVIHGGQDSRVWEVFGLGSVEPITGGVYEVTAADAELAAAKNSEYKALMARSRKLTIVRGRSALDGAEAVAKSVDGARKFEARVAYDATNLYVRFDVTTPSQLINAESDSKLLFRGGNCLDIQLAADPNADAKRKVPAVGDVRVLVSRQDGPSASSGQAKPYAVAFRPRVAGFTGERIVLKSPTGQEAFDAIQVLDTVSLDYAKTGDGFRATVALPLATLGWKPLPGQTVKMDLGYLFGNDTGTHSAVRAYWMNNGFAANVVNDVPHESRLEPAEWGTATVE